MDGNNSPETEKLISAFTEITSSSIKVAISFLGTHEWNLNAAVSTFFEANDSNPSENELLRRDPIEIPDSSSSSSDDSLPPLLLVRSRSPSDPSRFHYSFRPKLPGEDPFGCRTIKRRRYRRKVDYISDEAKEYYEEGDKSDTVLEKANESAMERPIQSSRSMSGETVSAEIQEEKLQDQSHDAVTSNSITSLESPRAFDGTRRTLAGSDSVSTEPPLTTTPPLSMGVPTTLIQIRLADGTRLVSRFNTHHTVRDVRGFIDVTRPDDSKDYQLFTMGFPPKPLPDLDQTIDKACISNSVLIQKY